jgi:putative tryptophan/tyrosine transport system substrate-binding protein
MRRRSFLAGMAGAAAIPLATRAQQSTPVVGWLNPRSSTTDGHLVAALRRGLNEAGFVEGRNVAFEYRWAGGQYNQLPALAADLVRRQVAVIVAGSPPGVAAAKAATTTIPIVFTSGGDPVAAGFVASLNRPGGNVTGVHILATELEAKRLEVLHELVQKKAPLIGMLMNPSYQEAQAQLGSVQKAARSLGLQLEILNARTESEIEAAFAMLIQKRADALLILTDPFFNSRHNQIVTLAARHSVPASYPLPEYARAGGLMSYGTDVANAYHQCGVYAGRILKGEKPSELPVMQSTKVELVINLKTAKAMGVSFPLALLGRADEVIE